MTELPSAYSAKDTEDKWYNAWETNNFFHAQASADKKPYCIVIPPPNVTGILHMGHALNNTIQDILIRYQKMRGLETLWMPGTDHAGIATQNVVEKMLMREGIKRQDLGRDKFLERVWKWKEEYGSTIVSQLKKLGSSCDWGRLRFTMDEGYSKAVREVFVLLYEKGLVYRGNYIVNWCPRCQTALSDEEAQRHEVQGNLYYIRYPLKEGSRAKGQGPRGKRPQDYIIVATTRPETMLGDTAVAVNPKDKRYKAMIGQTVTLPLISREIKIIADPMVDMKFGTGAVKVTPAHDPNDYALGKRHGLEFINIMHPNGVLNSEAGSYEGLDRFEARKVILEGLKKKKLLEKIEPHKLSAGHCYRCNTMIEPYLSRQWFVKMKPLAKPAIQVVKDGKIKFHPGRWGKVYLNWMENIQDWCISRQIWWGHRLPVYYCKSCIDSSLRASPAGASEAISKKGIASSVPSAPPRNDNIGVIVSRVKPEKCPHCGSTDIYQDEDVLDTWFSSWLWPFATFGWPFELSAISHQPSAERELTAESQKLKADLKYFYPTSTLVTAQEIIFFWVARMIMAGMEFVKDIPFKDVYIHGTVRDDTGKKMSKSLGNIIDPLEIINEFGADALRFSIISITAVGQDVFLAKQKFEIGRNFANKIWNASRFIITNLKPENIKVDLCASYDSAAFNLADRWILSRFYQALQRVERAIDSYRFNEAASVLYEFFWHEFCDWYIEFSKPYIAEPHTQIVLYKILEKSLRALHPFMPFITEEIWSNLRGTLDEGRGTLDEGLATITNEKWPHIQKQMIDKKIDDNMQLLIDLITAVRNIRASWNINPSVKLDILIKAKEEAAGIFRESRQYIRNLARVEGIDISDDIKKPEKSAAAVIKDIEIYMPLEKHINLNLEQQRLKKKVDEMAALIKGINAKLGNKDFLKKAPHEIVEKEKAKLAEFSDTLKRLKGNLKDLG